MDFPRIARKYVHVDVTATLFDGGPAEISQVDAALVPVDRQPTDGTVWASCTYADGTARVLVVGPDADPPTGSLQLSGTSDLWIRVMDDPEIDAVKIERIRVPA